MAADQSIMTSSAHRLQPSPAKRSRRRAQKYRSMKEIGKTVEYDTVDYSDNLTDVICVQCGSGEIEDQLLLCDQCDKAYHMLCLRPILVRVPIGPWYCPSCSDHRPTFKISGNFSKTTIFEFFGIKKCSSSSLKMISPQDSRKRKRRSGVLVRHKKKHVLLPYIPSADPDRRLKQMQSLASALMSLKLEFTDDLTYPLGMAPRSANQATFEKGGMQVLSKEDTKTLERCRAMAKTGECPPLLVVFDSCEGYTVQADGNIKEMTLLTEYAGDVDYIQSREQDDGDSLMTLLLANDPKKSLVICPDKRGNIARFFSGINNYIPESRKKKNIKCVRYNTNGECRVLLVATRDITQGERLYCDYNGHENAYPTHNFV